ncbi:MAG: 3'(2'),5'-bisphosphate nucleotidase CysQ [Parabacteroides merdae]
MMNNYANYLYIAIRAALDAGKAIMDIYTDPESDFGIERKADNSPLTKADKKAHAIISMALSVTPFPVLSEEGKETPFAERSGWDMLWIVDPLDGTKEFIDENGEFTVNIALVKEGVPVLGVIYVPVRKELYFAADSVGSVQAGGDRLRISASDDEIKRKPYACLRRWDTRESWWSACVRTRRKKRRPLSRTCASRDSRSLISSGSSLKICLVAEGTADVYPRFAPTMKWDTAADMRLHGRPDAKFIISMAKHL